MKTRNRLLALILTFVLVMGNSVAVLAEYSQSDGIDVYSFTSGAEGGDIPPSAPLSDTEATSPAALTIMPMIGIQTLNAPPQNPIIIPNITTLIADANGDGWTFTLVSGVLQLSGSGPFLIEGDATQAIGLLVNVSNGVSAEVIFRNVNIQPIQVNPSFIIQGSSGDVTIWIEGNNTFAGQGGSAGIFLQNRNLTINGTGSLEVIGSTWGAIEGQAGSSLTVNGSTVNVTAPGGANGIVVPSVTVTGGTVTDNGSPVPRTQAGQM